MASDPTTLPPTGTSTSSKRPKGRDATLAGISVDGKLVWDAKAEPELLDKPNELAARMVEALKKPPPAE